MSEKLEDSFIPAKIINNLLNDLAGKMSNELRARIYPKFGVEPVYY